MIEYYRDIVRRVHEHPAGWLVANDLDSHVAFVLGMDEGAGGNLLVGFHEFLIATIGTATTWFWPGLILWLTPPVGPKGRGVGPLPPELNDAAITRWYELLDEFLVIRAEPDGLVRIYRDYLGLIE
jgi:hypothetical protein